MIYDFPYLKDSVFLKKFDELKLKEQYVKLIVLTFDEMPIQEIQGKVTGGNFTLDGSSGMRRTGNLSMIADEYEIQTHKSGGISSWLHRLFHSGAVLSRIHAGRRLTEGT